MTAADVYRALWRHKTLILVLTGLCVAVTGILTIRQAKVYRASTLVRIQQVSAEDNASIALDASQRLTQTYAQIIDSGALTDRVRIAVAGANPSHRIANANLSAQPVQDTELMWIAARSRDRHDAASAANAAPPQLRTFMRETGRRGEEIVTVKKAGLPGSPASPQLLQNLLLALLLGLIFNGALALLIEVVRDRLPEPEELGASLGYPVLATIPVLYPGSSATPATNRRHVKERAASDP